jgi:hypothetical protein
LRSAAVLRKAIDQPVDQVQARRVAVERVEEDRVEQHARDLRGRRIAGHFRFGRLRWRSRVARRDRDDPACSELDRRREWRGQADPAVAVPRAVDLHCREEQRQRRGGHDVIDAQRAVGERPGAGACVQPAASRAILHPRHRLARRVARGGERERVEMAGGEVPRDVAQHAVGVGAERAHQQGAQRFGVDQAAHAL